MGKSIFLITRDELVSIDGLSETNQRILCDHTGRPELNSIIEDFKEEDGILKVKIKSGYWVSITEPKIEEREYL